MILFVEIAMASYCKEGQSSCDALMKVTNQ